MESTEDQRLFPRFESSPQEGESPGISVFIPDLMDEPQTPKDFSSGGFRLVLSKEPAIPHPPVSCSIKVNEISLAESTAEIAWAQENKTDPPTWTVGLSVEMGNENRDYFASLLTAFLTGNQLDP